MEKLTDSSLMPFGIHQGKKMSEIPCKYLLMVQHFKRNSINKHVLDYIHDNLTIIESKCLQK